MSWGKSRSAVASCRKMSGSPFRSRTFKSIDFALLAVLVLHLQDDRHRQVLVAVAGQTRLEDDAVVDVDRIVDLEIVQLEVADFVLVADADEEERHALFRGVLGGLRQSDGV